MQENGLEIAIIGMAGRFPGARTIEEFWQNLCHGVESITTFSDEELRAAGVAEKVFQQPSYVKRAGIIEDPELFDASFFGYSVREAEIIDPQQRIFLEIAWEALESAGYNPYTFEGLVGVFAGASMNTYMLNNLYPHRAKLEETGLFQAMLGNDKDFLATRISYKMNLRGPSLSLQTACSTSLVAVHYACQSLLSGESDMALAGGVSLRSPQKSGYLFTEGEIASPDGHCRTFDARAQGTVTSNGAGIVLLKRLADAIADKDQIYAVIKGSAINNDGAQKIGYTAPSTKGQAEVIRAAHLAAEVPAHTIGYVEAHGTATTLGDPIEIAALTQAFRADTQAHNFCAIGSVKSNMGHMDTAAGIAGLIKTALALKHRLIPPSLHYTQPNPKIDFEQSPFYVNTQLNPWTPSTEHPLRAGVSSFGIGGTNAHVILQEFLPEDTEYANAISDASLQAAQVLILSAKSAQSLERMTENLVLDLQKQAHNLADIAYTLHVGRETFPYRRVIICPNAALQSLTNPAHIFTSHQPPSQSQPSVAFLFPGQGVQHKGMALALYQQEPVFRAVLDRCAELLRPYIHDDILTILYQHDMQYSVDNISPLDQTALTQPALFIVEYALAQLWIERGVTPQAMLGHSIGEFVAACLAGVFSLEDALHIVAIRGQLMQQLEPGAMLSVFLSEKEIAPYLGTDIDLASVNSRNACTLAGSLSSIERVQKQLQSQGIETRRMRTSHAFHSSMMEPIVALFTEKVRQLQLHEPTIPYISNVTGNWITPQEATNPDYWGQHLRRTVRFVAGLQLLLDAQAWILLEVGPGQTLTNTARQHDTSGTGYTVFSSLDRTEQQDTTHFFTTLGKLWLSGVPIDWQRFHHKEKRQRVPLSTYAFERQRYWIDAPKNLASVAESADNLASDVAEQQSTSLAHSPTALRPQNIYTTYIPPASAQEQQIAAIWQQLLGDYPIGVADSFFELGGHSLAATRLVSRISTLFNIDFPLRLFLNNPTVEGIVQELELLQQQVGIFSRIPIVERDHPLPLSFAQQRMWFLHKLASDSSTYSIPALVRLTGSINQVALLQSVKSMLQRHEAFRTRIVNDTHIQPVQIIIAEEIQSLPEISVPGATLQEREQQALQMIQAEIQRPFHLDNDPLFRIKLFKIAKNDYILFFNMHHIVCDGWSIGILARDFTTYYTSYAHNQEITLSPLPIQYADYAVWQREWLQGTHKETLLHYWQKQLAHLPDRLNLPVDHPYPALQTYRGAIQAFALDSKLSSALYSFSHQENVTLFVVLLAVFMLQLQRYSRQDDILIGSPIAGRSTTTTEDIIGCFVNTLVFRGNLTGQRDFRTLLQQLRTTTFDAYEHQALPFEYLLESLQIERDLGRHPLFQVAFVLQNMPMSSLTLPDITITYPKLQSNTAKFDLTLLIDEQDKEKITGHFEYNSDLFEPATIARFIQHFQTLLRNSITYPSLPLSELTLLPADEKRQLLEEWNQAQTISPLAQSLHSRVSTIANNHPEQIALIFQQQKMTYGELEQRTNQLARWLKKQGVKQGSLVGLYVERSPAVVIGLLAILKAGGAYLPIDPAYPQERLNFMVKDAKIELLLTQHSLLSSLPPEQNVHIFCLDSDWQQCANETQDTFDCQVTGDSLAYVIYTSGSSGQSKGVKVSHNNVLRLFAATQDWYHFTDHDIWTFFHSQAFDFSVWEIWGALLYGGRLVIVPYITSRSPQDMYRLLIDEQVTILNQTPSAFHEIIHIEETMSSDISATLSLRLVIFGGEELNLASLRPWFERHHESSPQLVNMYGITETTVHTTYYPIKQADTIADQGSIIGRPLPDLQLYIADQYRQLAPIGVPGELYVGGAGVAQGYLWREQLTEEHFIPDPFTNHPEQILYKTGDLVRYLPSGDLVYMGRVDRQIKLRGFRIEPGEIETALSRHPAIENAIVTLQKEASGADYLIAYIKTQQTPPTVSALRAFLHQWLPEYMLPASFMTIESLPLTPNGKIDYQNLPTPAGMRPELDVPFVAPTTANEIALQEIWAQILPVDRVGVQDNFFALGGDSIISLRMLTLAQQRGLYLKLPHIFQYQTIQALAQVISTDPDTIEQLQTLRALTIISEGDLQRLPKGVEEAYPAATLQNGMLFHSELAPDTAVYHDIFSYHIRSAFHQAELQESLNRAITRHKVLRTAFDLSSCTVPLQLVYKEVSLPIKVDDITHISSDEQEALLETWISAEKQQPFNWRQAPLFRIHIHILSATAFQYTLSFHHAILDGWSVASFQTEIFQTYIHLIEGHDIPQPSSSMEYRDFIALEQQVIHEESQNRFWQEYLEDHIPGIVPRWPHMPPQSEQLAPYEQGQKHIVLINTNVSADLKRLAHQASVPLRSVLLAAHVRILSLLTGECDVLTGLVVNGRPEMADSDRTLGLFLNTVPLRIQVGTQTWLELIQETFAVERQLLPYRRYPMALVQQAAGHQQLFETAFNFIHFHVYKNIRQSQGMDIVDARIFTHTEFPFMANFMLDHDQAEVNLQLEYNASILSKEQIEQIGYYYKRALETIVANPNGYSPSQELLLRQEVQQQLTQWKLDQVEEARPQQCVYEVVETWAARTPHKAAVIYEDKTLSYLELNEQANQLAHYLVRQGVTPDTCVALCLERSTDLVIAALAVMKAGGAYISIDVTHPRERIQFMLDQIEARVVITKHQIQHRIHMLAPVILCLDIDHDKLSQEQTENLHVALHQENLAYIVYTSGSTGQPKGIQIAHRGILNLVRWYHETYHITSSDRTTMVVGLSFDVSVLEVWLALTAGASLYIASDEIRLSPPALCSWINKNAITIIHISTPIGELLTQEHMPDDTQLRVLITGGAQLHTYTPPNVPYVLTNTYGPAECTVTTAGTTGLPAAAGQKILPPIGPAITHTQIYILDQHMQLLPLGSIGEIYIGGVSLARGYVQRPDLTAERFVPHPYSQQPGQRLYRTGDMARFLPDGQIEFIGRSDKQIKIRGIRVELGEIQSALNTHPQIHTSVVTTRQGTNNEQRIVAYYQANAQEKLDNIELRSFLRHNLVEAMIPSYFIQVEQIPLTANGKVNYHALPAPAYDQSDHKTTYIQPQSELEQQLAAIWQDILQIEQVGIHDQFFDLGGHSLTLLRIHSRLQQDVQSTISLIDLFQYPTISQLAAYMEATSTNSARQLSAGPVPQEQADQRHSALKRRREFRQRQAK